jgi:hypothetical protein
VQRNAEKGLKDNRYFFYFINASITNFGTDEEKALFREAIRRDLLAQLLYMKFMFFESYTEIRAAQKILIGLYRNVLERDIKMTKELLDGFAQSAVLSKDNTVREYLHLGYRDLKISQVYFKMGDNFRETLYSMRLYKYVHAIKTAKHGKRYSFLSILLAMDLSALEKTKSEYQFHAYKMKLTQVKDSLSRLRFNELAKRLPEIQPAEKSSLYVLIHTDSFYRFKDPKSFYDTVWENPGINELKEYSEYMKLNE